MKLVTYDKGDGIARPGVVVSDGTEIIDLARASDGAIPSIQALIEGGEAAMERARAAETGRDERIALAEVRLRAPVEPPIQMRDCLCFETHLKQAFQQARKLRAREAADPAAAEAEMERKGVLAVPQTFYEQPIYYKANRFSVVGHEHDVIWPSYSKVMDFELEFAIYIGKTAKDVTREDARPYIFGYTIFNDFTARDAQTAEMGGSLGPAKGKDFDTANPMGPWLVTADEFGDPYDKTMICRVNGEEWGRGSTSSMYWSLEDVIAHVSASETLHPGEVLGSGTVGNGCGLEQMRFLAPGDVVELEVEGIGILRNRLVKPG